MTPSKLIDAICEELAPRAPAMIATIYGDIAMPHGGVLAMKSLIEISARLGFTETLVRTAVSRLVTSGRLVGERRGRLSFYRLTDNAKLEFAEVARQLHDPGPPASALAFHIAPGLTEQAARRYNLGRLSSDLHVSSQNAAAPPGTTVSFLVAEATDHARAVSLSQVLWPLDELAEGYRAMIDRFTSVDGVMPITDRQSALLLRLLLVHDYRLLLLRDPGLPAWMLPDDWPGDDARQLFDRLFRRLSEVAEPAIKALAEEPA